MTEYFVTGATGFVGSHVVERLVDRGDSVTALTRELSNAAHLPDAVTVVEGDITQKASMQKAMEDVDGVFHIAAWYQIGPGPENAERAHAINVEGTRNVLELMEELDISKGVYTSTVGVYGNTGDEIVDESYRSDTALPTVYQQTKWRAHYEVAVPKMENGLPLVIATFGGVYGPGEEDYGGPGHVRNGILGYLEEDIPMFPRGFNIPFHHVEDTATALLSAMDDGTPGEEYIIGGDQRRFADVFHVAEEVTGIPAPRVVSSSVFRVLSRLVGAAERVVTPPEGLRAEDFRFLGNTRVLVDTTKAERELNVQNRTLEEGLPDYLDWEMKQLGIQPGGRSPNNPVTP